MCEPWREVRKDGQVDKQMEGRIFGRMNKSVGE